jgi:hypothetical protein
LPPIAHTLDANPLPAQACLHASVRAPRPVHPTYDVTGAPEGPAEVVFNTFTEQGTLTLGREQYDVVKLGPGSGRWQLVHGGQVLAQAYKPSAFRRSFEIAGASGEMLLQASSAWGRSFDLLRGPVTIGRIKPTSPFRRRATVNCDRSISAAEQLFLFWLAVQMWRRAARNND